MNRAEWEAEVAALMALARAQRHEAIAARNPRHAMRAQLALMAAEGLLADQLSLANALLDVGQALVDPLAEKPDQRPSDQLVPDGG